MSKPMYIECSCSLPDHLIRFQVDNWDLLEPSLVISNQLNHYLPWYKRVWYGLKYILGAKSSVPHWAETILCPEDGDKLFEYLNMNWPKAM